MADALQVGQLVFSAEDNAEVTVLAICDDGKADVRRPDGIRPCRPLFTLTPLEPRVGDRVRVVAIGERSDFPKFGLKVGDDHVVTAYRPSSYMADVAFAGVREPGAHFEWNGKATVILLSRAPSPKSSEPVQPQRFYGTMPATLPKTLPDGTLCKAGWRHYGIRLCNDGRSYSFERYEFPETAVVHGDGNQPATFFDWSRIPVQPSEPQRTCPGEAGYACNCGHCGKPSETEGWRPKVGDQIVWKRFGADGALGSTSDGWGTLVGWSSTEPGCAIVRYENRALETVLAAENSATIQPSPPPSVSAERVICGVDPAMGHDRSFEVTMHGKKVVSVRDVGGSSKPDPYAEHERRLRELSGTRRLVMQNWFELEDRNAAKLAQATEQLGRKVEPRYAGDWDVSETEELYVS